VQTKAIIIAVVAFCALLGAVGQVFFKLASKDLQFNIPSLVQNWKLIIGLSAYAIATLLFVFALKRGNLSTLYPIIATSYIWVTIFSIYFLNETFPAYKWWGISFIIIGVSIIST
jgi:drug/metabolite transporter (DMT)-like permease